MKLFYHSTRPEEKHQNVFFISGPMNEYVCVCHAKVVVFSHVLDMFIASPGGRKSSGSRLACVVHFIVLPRFAAKCSVESRKISVQYLHNYFGYQYCEGNCKPRQLSIFDN